MRQTLADESAWLREDQVGLVEFRADGVEVGKSKPGFRIDDSRQGLSYCISRLIMPEPEMGDLNSTNVHGNSQNLRVSRLESQGRIEARTTLLDKCKVKPGRVCDCLHASLLGSGWGGWLCLIWRCVGVIQWNGWLVLNFEKHL